MNRLDSDYPALESLEREKRMLREQVVNERRKTTAVEARCNGMAAELTQSRLQHEQDCTDISSKHFENVRLRNRCSILEAKVADLEEKLTHAQAERR